MANQANILSARYRYGALAEDAKEESAMSMPSPQMQSAAHLWLVKLAQWSGVGNYLTRDYLW